MKTTSPNTTIGPYFPFDFVDECSDLTTKNPKGQKILLTGTVLEEGGKPTVNTILEIWQTDASGIFRSDADPRSKSADPAFPGWGRTRTDADGRYKIYTVLPGSYDGRVPHINVMILAIGLTRRLTTTVFFGSGNDPVLSLVPDPAKLAAVRETALDEEGFSAYRFDIVLRGEGETPFFAD